VVVIVTRLPGGVVHRSSFPHDSTPADPFGDVVFAEDVLASNISREMCVLTG
jgi:hypothetical protein